MPEDSPAKTGDKWVPCSPSQVTQNPDDEGGHDLRAHGADQSRSEAFPNDPRKRPKTNMVSKRAATRRQRAVQRRQHAPSTKLFVPAQRDGQAGEQPAGAHGLARRNTESLQLPPSGNDAKDRALAEGHPDLQAEGAYVHLANKMCPPQEQLLEAAASATLSFQKQMRPKDALERLALTQALMAHGRVAWLTKLATSQTDVPSLVTINEACELASGTFVRLMRPIGEYRRPTNSGPAISIGQANLAQ